MKHVTEAVKVIRGLSWTPFLSRMADSKVPKKIMEKVWEYKKQLGSTGGPKSRQSRRTNVAYHLQVYVFHINPEDCVHLDTCHNKHTLAPYALINS